MAVTANDIAIIIGAVCGGFAIVTGPAISIVTFVRMVRIEDAGKKNAVQLTTVIRAASDTTQKIDKVVEAGVVADQKLNKLHDLANGQSDKTNALSKALGVEEGKITGRDEERVNAAEMKGLIADKSHLEGFLEGKASERANPMVPGVTTVLDPDAPPIPSSASAAAIVPAKE